MSKVKASVYLDKETWERFKAVTKSLPGLPSASAMVNNYITGLVDLMEHALRAAQEGDRTELLRIVDSFVASNLATSGSELGSIRRQLMQDTGKEDGS